MAPKKSLVLLYLLGLVGIVAALRLQTAEHGHIREKRQSGQRPQAQLEGVRPSVGVSALGAAQASMLNSPMDVGGQLGANLGSSGVNAQLPATRPLRPKKPASVVEADAEAEMALEDEDRPVRVKPKKRRPTKKQQMRDEEDEEGAEDDYDCHHDDYDYGPGGFHEAAMRPMRHFGRMMDGMFSKMRGMAAGDFDGIPRGANAAVASSTSSGDGYSRTSSMVNNNGRTRGVVSETRNGRTRTRRIGSDDEDEE